MSRCHFRPNPHHRPFLPTSGLSISNLLSGVVTVVRVPSPFSRSCALPAESRATASFAFAIACALFFSCLCCLSAGEGWGRCWRLDWAWGEVREPLLEDDFEDGGICLSRLEKVVRSRGVRPVRKVLVTRRAERRREARTAHWRFFAR